MFKSTVDSEREQLWGGFLKTATYNKTKLCEHSNCLYVAATFIIDKEFQKFNNKKN